MPCDCILLARLTWILAIGLSCMHSWPDGVSLWLKNPSEIRPRVCCKIINGPCYVHAPTVTCHSIRSVSLSWGLLGGIQEVYSAAT